MRQLFRLAPVFLAAFLLAACTFSSSRGIYDGSDCAGWLRFEHEGAVTYRLHAYRDRRADTEIVFFGNRRGQLYLTIRPEGTGRLVFSASEKVEIRSSSGALIRELELQGEKRLEPPGAREFSIVLQVPDGEGFIVVLPSLKVTDRSLPPLKVNFQWTDRTVYSTQHVFGS